MPSLSVTYMDANATEPLRPEARAAMLTALDFTGNPSSVHGPGRAARRIMEDSREAIARRFGVRPRDVVFTSGGTEADALAVHALGCRRRLVISAVEHDAIRAAAAGAEAFPVSRSGVADLDRLEALLKGQAPALVCLMLANNETGVIQPVTEAAMLCSRFDAWLHVDAVQAAGRMAVDRTALGCHSVAISSHKLGGPAGVGALLLAPDIGHIQPLIAGGGQELGRRGGTPPVAAIAGFAAAVGAGWNRGIAAPLRDRAEAAAVACGAIVCGGDAPRLPNTTCIALPGVRADAQVIALDLEGIAVSAGAACSSGKIAASHVLAAMDLGPLAGQAIRISLPWTVTDANVAHFAAAYERMAARLRPALVSSAA
jgi:cysteine desulfurase